MKKVKLTLKYSGRFGGIESILHTGYTSETPGLAVCRKLEWKDDDYQDVETKWHYKLANNWWQVIHLASGLVVEPSMFHLTKRKDALKVAKALGKFVDWTLPTIELIELLSPTKKTLYALFDEYR